MTEITNIILACDESGAKGYADQQEIYPGEIGVFAGILVPEELQSDAQCALQDIYLHYHNSTGKLHITDLECAEQQNLRRDTYNAIKKLDLPCFWYAIHVAGLNDWYQTQQQLLEGIRENALAANPVPRYSFGSPRDDIPSMHEELFSGLYAHLIAFLKDRCRKNVAIELRTDRIDSPIVKNFEKSCEHLLHSYPHVQTVKGWDRQTSQKVEVSIEFNASDTSYIDVDIEVVNLTINPMPLGDGYTLAADVLANSLHYLFKNRNEAELYTSLNNPNAIRDHPLVDNLAAFYDWGNGDLIGDCLYSHPLSR